MKLELMALPFKEIEFHGHWPNPAMQHTICLDANLRAAFSLAQIDAQSNRC